MMDDECLCLNWRKQRQAGFSKMWVAAVGRIRKGWLGV